MPLERQQQELQHVRVRLPGQSRALVDRLADAIPETWRDRARDAGPRRWRDWLRDAAGQTRRRPRPAEPAQTIREAMARGYTLIPTVRIARLIRGRRAQPRRWWGLYLILVSEWPLLLNVLLFLVHRQWAVTRGYAMLWIGGFGASVALMLIAAMATWEYATERADLFDDIVGQSPERETIYGWFSRYMAFRRQLILPVAGAVGAPIYLYLTRTDFVHTVAVGFPSYALLSWVSFVGGNDVYWLFVATGLPKRIKRCTNLKLRWQDPASTPGLRLLADSYAISASFLLAGVVSISVLGFVVPRVLSSHVLLYTLYAFFVVSVCTTIRVAIIPLLWTRRIIVASKRSSLTTIDAMMPALDGKSSLPFDYIDKVSSVYSTLANAPDFPFSTGTVVQYSAGLVGSNLVFLLGLISHVKP